MSVTIKKCETAKDWNAYVDFPLELFKDMKTYVPGIAFDEKDTLNPKKNPAFEFSEAESYLAYKDGKVVGRVTAIVNNKANEVWNHKEVRFGWFDFVDDKEVSKALLDQVVKFGKDRGMDTIVGPLGFTDFDPEGMLIEGFDEMSTMALRHCWPYYKEHMEAHEYEKEVDWLEYKVYIPDELPEKYTRIANLCKERYNLHCRRPLSRKELQHEGLGDKLFAVIVDTYKGLYNYTPLTKRCIDNLIDFYLGLLDLDFVSIVEDENNEIVAFGVSMPSITRAIQKSKGKLFPFGWWYLLKSLKFKPEENLEMFLIGVKDEYKKRGVTAMVFSDIYPACKKAGLKYAEGNAELENNYYVRNLWEGFKYDQNKRRRVFRKSI